MNVIIPMAGMGKRLRPHTLTTPKPLLPIAGKPIVQRIVEDIARVCDEPIDEIAFIISGLSHETQQSLVDIAKKCGARGSIWFQDEPLGTAHAILCAEACLKGKVIVAFADTLFKADFKMDSNVEGTVWVQKVNDPRQFGVVKINDEGVITDFVEKPDEFVSDLAIIGIYYFSNGEHLKNELHYLLDNNIKDKGEFQLTNALENMKEKGLKFVPGTVTEWLDCGNKDAMIFTNERILEFVKDKEVLVSDDITMDTNSTLIQPCYIAPGVSIIDSTVGPYVSIGEDTIIEHSVVKNSIIQKNNVIKNAKLENAMLGNHVSYSGESHGASLGDYSAHSK